MNNIASRITDIDSMDISIKEIIYFITVAENGSITKAAQILFVAQPYLSKMIQGMEKKVGVQLFERTGKSVCLSPAGKVFYEHMSRVMGMMLDGYERTRNTGNSRETVLNTVVSYDLDPVKLSEDERLRRLFDMSLVECRHFYDILDGIQAGRTDCAVIFRDYISYFQDCVCRELNTIDAYALVSYDHWFATRTSVTGEDVRNEEICFYIERSIENKLLLSTLSNYCRQISIDPGEAHIADNYLSALYYAAEHKAVVFGNVYSLIPDSGKIKPVRIADRTQTLCLVISAQLSDAKRDMIETIIHS